MEVCTEKCAMLITTGKREITERIELPKSRNNYNA